jgi:hypothetical protein
MWPGSVNGKNPLSTSFTSINCVVLSITVSAAASFPTINSSHFLLLQHGHTLIVYFGRHKLFLHYALTLIASKPHFTLAFEEPLVLINTRLCISASYNKPETLYHSHGTHSPSGSDAWRRLHFCYNCLGSLSQISFGRSHLFAHRHLLLNLPHCKRSPSILEDTSNV